MKTSLYISLFFIGLKAQENSWVEVKKLEDLDSFSGIPVLFKTESDSYLTSDLLSKISDNYCGFIDDKVEKWQNGKGRAFPRLTLTNAPPKFCTLTDELLNSVKLSVRQLSISEIVSLKNLLFQSKAKFEITSTALRRYLYPEPNS